MGRLDDLVASRARKKETKTFSLCQTLFRHDEAQEMAMYLCGSMIKGSHDAHFRTGMISQVAIHQGYEGIEPGTWYAYPHGLFIGMGEKERYLLRVAQTVVRLNGSIETLPSSRVVAAFHLPRSAPRHFKLCNKGLRIISAEEGLEKSFIPIGGTIKGYAKLTLPEDIGRYLPQYTSP